MFELSFIKEFVKNTREVGAICPSGKNLTSAMSNYIKFNKDEFIAVELGGGSGALSLNLAQKMQKMPCPKKLVVLEINEKFYKTLVEKLRGYDFVIVLNASADNLKNELEKLNIKRVDYVFSCLPFLAFSRSLRLGIYGELIKILDAEAHFVLFQYTKKLLKELKQNFKIMHQKRIFLNLPPAIVWDMQIR